MNAPARADALVVEIAALLAGDDGGPAVTVTADPLKIPAALSDGRPVVAIQPPELSYPTFYVTETNWELFVIAGPFADQRRAWDTIAGIIDRLKVPLAIATAKPASFAAPSMPEYPAYVLTFSETT